MGQNATLKKISTQLKLSISTVSRALNNHPDISEKTKKKVKELALLMEYEPNSYAVNLRTNKSRVFGLIVPAISNMFYDSFIASVEEESRKNGYSLLILQSGDDSQQETANLKLCKHNRVDGVFISMAPGNDIAQRIANYQGMQAPIIFFDRVPDDSPFDSICMADEEAATIAAHTIIKYNRKNVLALFGNPELSITRKRKQAFVQILDHHPGINTSLKHCYNTEEARLTVMEALKNNPLPDHIFCMSDELLIGAMKSIHRSGLSVPRDVSVLAISNGAIPGLFNPEITYIETSGYALGKLAIKRMLEHMQGKTEPRSIILPSRLVEGGSL